VIDDCVAGNAVLPKLRCFRSADPDENKTSAHLRSSRLHPIACKERERVILLTLALESQFCCATKNRILFCCWHLDQESILIRGIRTWNLHTAPLASFASLVRNEDILIERDHHLLINQSTPS
jgi:hypothetical protein